MRIMKQGSTKQLYVAESATAVGDLIDLRAFCLVTDLRSLTAAAKALRESKATVSRRISRLEAALGVSLLRRTPRLVEPTDDGAAYRVRVGEVLDLLGAANDSVRQAREAPSGLLRVTSGPEFNAVLAPVVVGFVDRHPAVRLEMVVTQAALDFDADRIDVALRVSLQLADSALIAHKVLPLDLAAVASPDYLARHPAPRVPEALSSHRIVFLPPRGDAFPIRHRTTGKITKIAARPTLVVTEMNFMIEVARAGGGIAFAPKIAVARELASGALVQVLSDYEIAGASLYLLHRGGRFIPPKVRAFRDFVVDAFAVKGRVR